MTRSSPRRLKLTLYFESVLPDAPMPNICMEDPSFASPKVCTHCSVMQLNCAPGSKNARHLICSWDPGFSIDTNAVARIIWEFPLIPRLDCAFSVDTNADWLLLTALEDWAIATWALSSLSLSRWIKEWRFPRQVRQTDLHGHWLIMLDDRGQLKHSFFCFSKSTRAATSILTILYLVISLANLANIGLCDTCTVGLTTFWSGLSMSVPSSSIGAFTCALTVFVSAGSTLLSFAELDSSARYRSDEKSVVCWIVWRSLPAWASSHAFLDSELSFSLMW